MKIDLIEEIKNRVYDNEEDEYEKNGPLDFVSINFVLNEYDHEDLDSLLTAIQFENIRAKNQKRKDNGGTPPWYAFA